ncbi:hypothetical protein M431DRAFT_249660 [Trichoderma harzianum CBS 226.95]|uniref:Uncharacterized protein n=1 Tax=Trichoderma harzianum CBS 226.95 TaxID=983964 RepID=A0A2T3ZZZ2_TRIHA|nr:hypothetical protein M431DRAFT_249660 [Trichoderma harzianum CBS 226.95]PTB50313.1 hypothetical protein M431DRAFT_249660 [Trichoderma harzianum CBS 226.95]
MSAASGWSKFAANFNESYSDKHIQRPTGGLTTCHSDSRSRLCDSSRVSLIKTSIVVAVAIRHGAELRSTAMRQLHADGIAAFASPHLELIDGAGEMPAFTLSEPCFSPPSASAPFWVMILAYPDYEYASALYGQCPSRGRQQEPACQCGCFKTNKASSKAATLIRGLAVL